MSCSVDIVERRYAGVIKDGEASIRGMQYKRAMEGNTGMLIWLGKHYLQQREDTHYQATNEPEVRRLLALWETAKAS